MSRKSGGGQPWVIWGLAFLVMLVVVGVTARGVWQQIARLRQIRVAQMELQSQIQYEQARKQALEKELRRVSSPEYAEEWARVYGGMVRPGEVRLVVPDQSSVGRR